MEESKVDLVEDETLEKLEEINQDITKLNRSLKKFLIQNNWICLNIIENREEDFRER